MSNRLVRLYGDALIMMVIAPKNEKEPNVPKRLFASKSN